MIVQDLLTRLSTDLNDPNNVEFSVSELINKINSGLRWLSLELANIGARLTLNTATLTVVGGTATLPPDFISDVTVLYNQPNNNIVYYSGNPANPTILNEPRYLIVGNQILISVPDNSQITLYYYQMLPYVANVTDTLPIPDYVADILREYVLFTARRRVDLPLAPDLLNDLRQKLMQVAYVNTANLDAKAPFIIMSGFTWW